MEILVHPGPSHCKRRANVVARLLQRFRNDLHKDLEMRTSSRLALPFVALALAACDRGADPAESDASRYTRNGPETKPRAAEPSVQQPSPPRPTLAPATAPADSLTDTAITGKIKAAILTDPGMTGADVTVSTDHGVVVLAGVVKAQEQIAIASAHAQRQDGVLRVDNQLSRAPQ
jgi:hypothetical protein